MRRLLLALALGLACALPAAAADTPAVWHGNGVLTGGKGYVTTPMGELHYRDIGPRDTATPFLLLHQSPWSMVEFAEIQNAMAAKGYRAVAVDTPGYGLSDAPPNQPTIEGLADNLIPLLDALKIKKVVLGGHHTGASIAVAFAARHPDRVAGVLIHGVPFYDAEERAARAANKSADRALAPDGSHLSNYFKGVLAGLSDPSDSPSTAFTNERIATWAVLNRFLVAKDNAVAAVVAYDLEPGLKKIAAPTLVMSDTQDGLHDMDMRTVKLRSDFAYTEFSQGGLLSLMAYPDKWAEIAVEFARSKAAK